MQRGTYCMCKGGRSVKPTTQPTAAIWTCGVRYVDIAAYSTWTININSKLPSLECTMHTSQWSQKLYGNIKENKPFPVLSMLASGTRVRRFKPGRSRRIFRAKKILSMPSFRGEVKSSVPCRSFAACKKKSLTISVEVVIVRLNLIGHFSPIIPPFTNRGLSRRLTWSASGDDGGNWKRAQWACRLRPRCIGAVGPRNRVPIHLSIYLPSSELQNYCIYPSKLLFKV
jgi:hypothetical protein